MKTQDGLICLLSGAAYFDVPLDGPVLGTSEVRAPQRVEGVRTVSEPQTVMILVKR